MKAIQVHKIGGPGVLSYDEIPRPQPGPGDVLIRVHAAGLNPPDWYSRGTIPSIIPEAMRARPNLPFTPGSDVSGVVEELGAGVTEFRVGDEVFGMVRFPSLRHNNIGGKGYAEYTTSPASHLARKPRNIDHIHAAAVPMSGLTAWQYLFKHGSDPVRDAEAALFPWAVGPRTPVPLGPNKVVLVNGAAGGVGHFVVQFAKMKGSRVIGVASGRHEKLLRQLGVDQFIDYTKTPAEDVAADVDLLVDTVGGVDGYRFLRVLKPGGTVCPVFIGEYHRDEAAAKRITIQMGQVFSSGAHMAELAELLEHGKIQVVVDSIFPLADARLAHERAEQGHIQGKIVLQCK